jgi:hypothetical protein
VSAHDGERVPAHLDPTPLTRLEEVLDSAARGQGEEDPMAPILEFLNSLVCLLVPEPAAGETDTVEPLVLNNADGNPVVAAFTHRARIRPDFLEFAPTVVETQGALLLQNLGTELGLVLNPGSAFGFELSTEHVAAVLRDFRPAEPGEHPDVPPGPAGE